MRTSGSRAECGAGDAHAGRHRRAASVQLERPPHELERARRQARRPALVRVVQQPDELIGVHPREPAARRRGLPQPRRQLAEQPIARRAAESVVDRAEAVQVERERGGGSIHVLSSSRPLEHRRAVWQPGERVLAPAGNLQLPPRQLRAQPRERDGEVDRLGDVVVGAKAERLDDRVAVLLAGNHDDRQVGRRGALPQAPQHLEAAHGRHLDVEQDQVEGALCDRLDRGGTVPDGDRVVPVPPQTAREDLAAHFLVVNDEHLRLRHDSAGPSAGTARHRIGPARRVLPDAPTPPLRRSRRRSICARSAAA